MPGEFIDVKVDAAIAKDVEIAKKLEEVCPVSIFVAESDGVDAFSQTGAEPISKPVVERALLIAQFTNERLFCLLG